MHKLKFAVLAAVLLIVVVVAAWLFVGSSKNDSANNSAQVAAPNASTTSMSADDERRFELALNSADINQQASVMTAEMGAAYKSMGQSMLPDGSQVDILPETMTVSDNVASVEATLTFSGQTSEYWLVLARTDASSPWLLLTTEGK
ncbi:MAG: hypothetical protein PVI21_02680 [Candidatus Woesebacteria bacterium]|jgi:hypothetical protein